MDADLSAEYASEITRLLIDIQELRAALIGARHFILDTAGDGNCDTRLIFQRIDKALKEDVHAA